MLVGARRLAPATVASVQRARAVTFHRCALRDGPFPLYIARVTPGRSRVGCARGGRRPRHLQQQRHGRGFFMGEPPLRSAAQQAELEDVAPETMFEVVWDMQHYHEFLPFCSSSTVSDHDPPVALSSESRSQSQPPLLTSSGSFTGRLAVAYGGLYDETYSSRVTFERPAGRIRSEALDSGNFKLLVSDWKIDPLQSSAAHTELGCKVSCKLEFRASGHLLDHLLSDNAPSIVASQVEAFVARARTLQRRRDDPAASTRASAVASGGGEDNAAAGGGEADSDTGRDSTGGRSPTSGSQAS